MPFFFFWPAMNLWNLAILILLAINRVPVKVVKYDFFVPQNFFMDRRAVIIGYLLILKLQIRM